MRVLFIRDFIAPAGGHLKLLDYLRHVATSGFAKPALYQTPRSRTVPGNIFNALDGVAIEELQPFPAYFLAGEDWFILDAAGIDPGNAPVFNLIQGFRHAEPGNPLFACLSRPAVRICVSPEVADAIRPHANGDLFVIENGIDITPPANTRPLDAPARVMIAGMKNVPMASDIAARLEGAVDVDLASGPLPRDEFLARVGAASIGVFLPVAREGFFLPPLEAMALGRAVVTPDCWGNRCYCEPDINCLMPAYDAEALAAAALSLVNDRGLRTRLAAAGQTTAEARTIERERREFHAILTRYIGDRS